VIAVDLAGPERLAGLALVALTWFLLRSRAATTAARARECFGARAEELSDRDSRRVARRRAWFAGGAAAGVLAFADPRFGTPDRLPEPQGADVVVCLDVSRSMAAQDAAPDRLTAAKAAIRALAARAEGDRLGLILFAGEAVLAAPLTRDRRAFEMLLEAADPWSVACGGTDVGAAVLAGLGALAAGRGDHAALVLVSDGEDLAPTAESALAALRTRGAPLHAAAVGSTRGAKIPVPAANGGVDFVRDETGAEVVSVPDREGLRRWANAGGGDYVDLEGGPQALAALYERAILPRSRAALAAGDDAGLPVRFQWPLALALALLLYEAASSERRRR
jgi:Ca-activated chloride channel family protein